MNFPKITICSLLIAYEGFKLFAFKRKTIIFCPIEGFFELHSTATERKKWVKKGYFLANGKSLSLLYVKRRITPFIATISYGIGSILDSCRYHFSYVVEGSGYESVFDDKLEAK